MDLTGKTALVTGAGRGIGREIAELFALHGAQVVANDLKTEGTTEGCQYGNQQIFPYHANAVDKNEVTDMFEWIKDKFGHLDILVNNVGVLRDNTITKMEEDEWDFVLETNLKSYFLCSQQAAKMMIPRQKGRIINISSRAWLGGYGQANYSASKGGVVSLTRSLAIELAKHNITVNALAPGIIDTPLFQSFRPDVRERLIKMQPIQQLGKPEDVAYAALFFASDHTGYITGQTLHICGGKSIFSLGF